MSADSLFGGSTDLSQTVDPQSLALINQFLTDTVAGSVITSLFGDSTLIVGSGHAGELQGAILPGTQDFTGTMDDGSLKLTISLPADTGILFAGKDATPDVVSQFLNDSIDSYLPPGTNDALAASLKSGVADLIANLKGAGVSNVTVRLLDITNAHAGGQANLGATTSNELVLDAGATTGNQLFAVNLGHLNASDTLVLKGVESAFLSGSGTVRFEGSTGVRVTSDGADQNIIGGGGNDTLIGGGGHDTLTGGAGNDVFGFSHLGNFEITDFSAAAGDKIAFDIAGVTSVAQLLPLVTSVTESAQGVTYHFGPNASITLVGLSAHDVTADLIKFSI